TADSNAGYAVYYWLYIRAKGSAPVFETEAVLLPRASGGYISGKVTDAVTGAPLAQAAVELENVGENFHDIAITVSDGSFFKWEPAWVGWTVHASHQDYLPAVQTIST